MNHFYRLLGLLLAVLVCLPLAAADALASEEPDTSASGEPPASAYDGAAADTEYPAGGSTEYADGPTVSLTPGGEGDNDALFAAWAESVLYGAPLSGDAAPVLDGMTLGDRLTDMDAVLYNYLLPYMRQIAAGERTSTVFEIPLGELGVQLGWTAEELGVSVINADTLDTVKDVFSEAATRGIGEFASCLTADLPYEMYWFDKTAGWQYSLSYQFSYYPDRATFSGSLRIVFYVAQDYALEYEAEDGQHYLDLTRVDAARYGQAVSTAVSTAQDIVDQYADANDYDKLAAYKDAICSLVSYDYDAADNANSVAYGNPWQLISVFDGDQDTNVVCEGYAKAFQYLCDLTAFRTDVDCYCVSGFVDSTTDSTTGQGRHMWDIVRMEDGKNYLVDVTNSDEGMIGHPDKLFLVGWSEGDVFESHTCDCGSQSITYRYDDDMRSRFTEQELTIASSAYTPSAILYGDADGSGGVDAYDAALVMQYAVGRLPADADFDEAAANITGDGSIDALDAARILALSH